MSRLEISLREIVELPWVFFDLVYDMPQLECWGYRGWLKQKFKDIGFDLTRPITSYESPEKMCIVYSQE